MCGFNYGAKQYGRVMDAFWFCVKTLAVVQTVISIILFVFSTQVISIFRKEDIDLITIGARALKLQCLTFPLFAWVIITNMLLQVLGKGTQASITAISRQGLFFLPAVLILPRIFGITGIQISQPAADLLTFLIAVPMGIGVLRELRIKRENTANQPEIGEGAEGVIS